MSAADESAALIGKIGTGWLSVAVPHIVATMHRKVYILGAAGSGVSTLGCELGRALAVPWFDVDDYYWLPTDPPFRTKRPIEERIALLNADLAAPSWVLSGSLDGWGDTIANRATHVVYVDTDTLIRIRRLRDRELSRFGARVRLGGDMAQQHEEFINWAESYDLGTQPGRSRPRHEAWLGGRAGPVIRVDGSRPIDALVAEVLKATTA